ncbi:MAG: TolC family protein [Chitinophagaceae bacterium]|jgi:outer membrane protein TolC
MRRLLSLLFLSVSILPFSSNAQEVMSLSLSECVDYALKNSAAAKNASIDVELQKAQNNEVTGRALPQISGEGKYTQFFDVQQQFLPSQFAGLPPGDFVPLGFSPKLSSIGQLNASQLLFNGSVIVALQARKTLMELARYSASMKIEDIRYNIQKAYFGLIIAHRQFDLMNNSLELLRNTTRDLQITFENGMIEKLEVNRMEVQLSNLQADSLGLANMIDVSERMLKYTMGMDLNIPIKLTDDGMLENLEAANALILQDVQYENRLGFQLASTSLRLQEYDLKRYRYEGLPTLAAFGSIGYNRAADKFDDLINKPYPGFSLVGLQLNVPIFDGFQRRSRVRSAKLKVQKAENDLENTKLGIDFQTKSARATLTNSLQTIESRKRTMDLANSVLDLSKKKYKAGVGSNQDVVLAQSDYLQAQNNYFAALQSVINAQADLQKSLGLLK